MNTQDLRKLLEKTDDKSSIFASSEILNQYDFNMTEFFDLVKEFLSDEEKLKLLNYSHFQGTESWIIGSITDEDIKMQILSNNSIMSNFENDQIVDIIKGLTDDRKLQILCNQTFMEKYQFTNHELGDIISFFSDKETILIDKELIIDKLHLSNCQIAEFTKDLSSEDAKVKVLEIYRLRRRFDD